MSYLKLSVFDPLKIEPEPEKRIEVGLVLERVGAGVYVKIVDAKTGKKLQTCYGDGQDYVAGFYSTPEGKITMVRCINPNREFIDRTTPTNTKDARITLMYEKENA